MFVDKLISSSWRCLYGEEKLEIRGRSDYNNGMIYTESDVDNFVEIIFRRIAEELNVKYMSIKDVLYGKNVSFFNKKAKQFYDVDDLEQSEVFTLLSLLLVPNIEELGQKTRAERFMEDFEELDVSEKIEVLDRLNNMRIKFQGEVNSSEAGTFLEQFSELSKQDKYLALKQIFKAEVVEGFNTNYKNQ